MKKEFDTVIKTWNGMPVSHIGVTMFQLHFQLQLPANSYLRKQQVLTRIFGFLPLIMTSGFSLASCCKHLGISVCHLFLLFAFQISNNENKLYNFLEKKKKIRGVGVSYSG